MTQAIVGVMRDERYCLWTPMWGDISEHTCTPFLRPLPSIKQASMILPRTPILFLVRSVLQTVGKTLPREIYESYLLILQVGKLMSGDQGNLQFKSMAGAGTCTKIWIYMDICAPRCCPSFYTPHKLVSVSH